MKNTNKGITLIALVITIIVMLILVAVTITMAVNGGLFEYAGRAATQTNEAIEKEQNLASGGLNIAGTWYNSIDEYVKSQEKKDASSLNEGDIVNYQPVERTYETTFSETGCDSQTFSTEDLIWRVLEKNEDNIVLIGSASSMALNLTAHEEGHYNEEVINNICKELYSMRGEDGTILYEARSVDSSDDMESRSDILKNGTYFLSDFYTKEPSSGGWYGTQVYYMDEGTSTAILLCGAYGQEVASYSFRPVITLPISVVSEIM